MAMRGSLQILPQFPSPTTSRPGTLGIPLTLNDPAYGPTGFTDLQDDANL